MVQENVFAQLSNIKTHPSVAVGLRNNSLRLHGWVYDIESGKILALIKRRKASSRCLKTRKCSSNNLALQGMEALSVLHVR